MSSRLKRILSLSPLIGLAALAGSGAGAQDNTTSEDKLGWSSSVEFSIAVTQGNSDTQTVALNSTTARRGESGTFRLRLDGMRSDTAEDRFLRVESGLTWEPGASPPSAFTTSVVEPAVEPDVEKYLAEGRYDRQISRRRTWNAGGSWERNKDAGILNRYVVFGGVGHDWKDKERLSFRTSYGVSVTDREEETPDPEKDKTFAGVRLDSSLRLAVGKSGEYRNEFTGNISLKDPEDYNLEMTNSISVNLTKHLALKTSLQWLYNNEPAQEDVDLIAHVILIDPDGIPGNGDEVFQTVADSGTEIVLGEAQTRRESLDTVFRTSLVLKF